MLVHFDQVFTCGYQGKTLLEFIEVLKENGVTVVVDIRRRPISRRAGFSKSKLQQALSSQGIKYEHFRSLGMPEEWLPLRSERDGNREVISLYRETMPDRILAIKELSRLASREVVCIVCYEANHEHCHRSVVADLLKARKFEVRHLR
jgi:uncharacterized protein (DUF488 family)